MADNAVSGDIFVQIKLNKYVKIILCSNAPAWYEHDGFLQFFVCQV